jgi:chitodextrinase
MRLQAIHYSILGFLLSFSFVTYGASTDFTVRTFIGEDTTPPTVPANLTATPVATTQINLSWDSSTDDFLLSGYQVFRDGTQVATTTLTSLSDTGLTPSTTYAYYITAFDSFNNFSASSTVVATTTLAVTPTTTPTTTPSSGTRYGSRVHLGELTSLQIIPSQYGVIIRYETSGFVRSVVRFGTTVSYELGSTAERAFTKVHETVINDLTPNTKYKFIIEGDNRLGISGVLTESTFTTLPLDDVTPPSNVTGLSAERVGNDIVLTWKNPEESDFEYVRILRNDQFYPSDVVDGWVVYESNGTAVLDKGAALLAPQQFYTVFSYDVEGNISSGAVVSIRFKGDTTEPIDVIVETENPINLDLSKIVLTQEGKQIPFVRGTAVIDGAKHLSISIAYDALPEHLKTILVTLVSGTDPEKELNFLLRINAEKTSYVAHLAPLGVQGNFPLRIAVFDFKTTQIGYTRGRIISEIVAYEEEESSEGKSFLGSLMEFIRTMHLGYLLVFVILLIALVFLARRLLHRNN